MEYLLLLIGFVLLVKGADVFVTGAGSVAKKFKIPDLIIGLTVVAFGTSAPEIAVSTVASVGGQNAMAISNILGSNIFNLLVVLGVCAIIVPIEVDGKILKKEFPFAVLTQILLILMLADQFLGNGSLNVLSRGDGLILLLAFSIFMFYVITSAKNHDESEEEFGEEEIKEVSTLSSVLMIVLGLAAVVFGGDLVVKAATEIAYSFGVSEALVGLTIVAMGTSLPELVTSIIACRKGSSDMALGNVIGSNIFNVLLTLGLCSTISPIAVEYISVIDSIIVLGVTLVVFFMAKTGKKITKVEGFTMLIIFAVYNFYIISR